MKVCLEKKTRNIPPKLCAKKSPIQLKNSKKIESGIAKNDLSLRWQSDEKLGHQATCAMILYANKNHPNLKLKYPNFNERIQQITKIWKNLPTSKKQSFTAQARENHVSSRKSKATKSNVISNNLETSSSFKPRYVFT